MTRIRQGGSIVGYAVIGGVLALLLIGGVFFAKQKSVAPDTSKAPSVTEQGQQQLPPQTSDKKPDESQHEPSPKPAQDKPKPRHENHAKELPKTGMGDVLSAVMLSAIAFLAASYIQSRRQLSSL